MKLDEQGLSWLEFLIAGLVFLVLIGALAPRLESLIQRSQHRLLQLNARAFEQAVQLAQLQYQMAGRAGAVADLPGYLSQKLDFNRQGFPVGLSAQRNSLAPASVLHCEELWSELLSQPRLSSHSARRQTGIDIGYWPRPGKPSLCRYRLMVDPNLGFDYDADNGQIRLHSGWQTSEP